MGERLMGSLAMEALSWQRLDRLRYPTRGVTLSIGNAVRLDKAGHRGEQGGHASNHRGVVS